MTLDKLIDYYRIREYQISHLINARKCHRYGKNGEQQMYLFLLFWADAMYIADEMSHRSDYFNSYLESRGLA